MTVQQDSPTEQTTVVQKPLPRQPLFSEVPSLECWELNLGLLQDLWAMSPASLRLLGVSHFLTMTEWLYEENWLRAGAGNPYLTSQHSEDTQESQECVWGQSWYLTEKNFQMTGSSLRTAASVTTGLTTQTPSALGQQTGYTEGSLPFPTR